MKHRSAAMLLSLAVWSCALQPARGPRPRAEPPAGAETGSGRAPRVGAGMGAGGAAGAVEAGAGSAGQAPRAEAGGDARAAPWIDPRIDLEFMALQVLAEANKVRIQAGSGHLVVDPALRRAARRYSRELAARQEIEHRSATPGRRTFRERIAAEGARARVAGENLARLTASETSLPLRAVQAWMKSPGHRRNLLDPIFTRTGIGVMLGRDGIWYVAQIYATRS